MHLAAYEDSKAAECFLKVLAAEPGNVAVLKKAAVVLASQPGKQDEANRLVTKAIAIYGPLSAELWDAKGYVLRLAGRYEEALVCLERALQLNPALAQAHWNKGLALNALRRYGPAVLALDRARELAPNEPELDWARGKALYFLGKEEEAFRWLQDEARLAQAGKRALFFRALAAYKAGRYEAALQLFAQAPLGGQANPEDRSDLEAWQGECLLALGRAQDALGHFERALESSVDEPLALHGKAQCLEKLGRGSEVQALYDKALAKDAIYYKQDYFRLKEPRYR